MRLERLAVEGVGPFERLELDFPKGTDPSLADAYLLVGPNGCGKSTLISAIAGAFGSTEAVQPRMWSPAAARDDDRG